MYKILYDYRFKTFSHKTIKMYIAIKLKVGLFTIFLKSINNVINKNKYQCQSAGLGLSSHSCSAYIYIIPRTIIILEQLSHCCW